MAKSDFDKALALIAKKGTARTDSVADHLGIAPEAVAELLHPAIESGYLVSCTILRPGKPDSAEYRVCLAADDASPLRPVPFAITRKRAEVARTAIRHTPPTRLEIRDFKAVEPVKSAPETPMSQETQITRQQVLDVIQSAGAAGITRAALVGRFGGKAGAIDQHLLTLATQKPPAIHRPSRGLIVASGMQPEPARKVVQSAAGKQMHATREAVLGWLGNQREGYCALAQAIAQAIGCTEDSTRAVLAGLYAGMKVDRIDVGGDWGYSIGTPTLDTRDAAATDHCREQTAKSETQTGLSCADETQTCTQQTQGADPFAVVGFDLGIAERDKTAIFISQPMASEPAVVEDILLDTPDDVEFAIFSSGGLDIYCADTTITLNKAVLGKLRGFLGLFQGDAA